MSTAAHETHVVRVNLSAADMRALRVRAAELGVSVPMLLGKLVRRELHAAAPETEHGE